MWYKIERTIVAPHEVFTIEKVLSPFLAISRKRRSSKKRIKLEHRFSIPQLNVGIEIWEKNGTDFVRVYEGQTVCDPEYVLHLYQVWRFEQLKLNIQ